MRDAIPHVIAHRATSPLKPKAMGCSPLSGEHLRRGRPSSKDKPHKVRFIFQGGSGSLCTSKHDADFLRIIIRTVGRCYPFYGKHLRRGSRWRHQRQQRRQKWSCAVVGVVCSAGAVIVTCVCRCGCFVKCMHSAYVLALFETRENRVFDWERCYFVQFQKITNNPAY